MNAASKLNIVTQLLESGLLCKCDKFEETPVYDLDYDEEYKLKLKHEFNCEGKEKVKQLLGLK